MTSLLFQITNTKLYMLIIVNVYLFNFEIYNNI